MIVLVTTASCQWLLNQILSNYGHSTEDILLAYPIHKPQCGSIKLVSFLSHFHKQSRDDLEIKPTCIPTLFKMREIVLLPGNYGRLTLALIVKEESQQ